MNNVKIQQKRKYKFINKRFNRCSRGTSMRFAFRLSKNSPPPCSQIRFAYMPDFSSNKTRLFSSFADSTWLLLFVRHFSFSAGCDESGFLS